MKKIVTVPTIIGVFFLVASVFAGVILIQRTQTFRSGASETTEPKDVKISNITDTSFVVSWITDQATDGFVKYGTSSSSINQTALDQIQKNTVHYVRVNRLDPDKEYFFTINSNGQDYDSNGIPWNAKTGITIGVPESTIIISGKVENELGFPASNSLVFANLPGGTTQSTATGQEGGWIITLSLSRSVTLNSYATFDSKNTTVELLVQGVDGNISTAKITPDAGRNTPTMILGKVHDFTNTPEIVSEDVANASLEVPQQFDQFESKFNVDTISTPSSETVVLESHDEGETISTYTPEFFGDGPPGTTLTITIESDPITESISVNNNGDWNWSPPVDLEQGEHKITIAWRDAQGILRNLTRSFTVSALEVDPAFESTPSASLTPTPTPTLAPTPTPTPTTISTSTPEATGSPVPIPDSGILTPTIVLSIMGVGLILLGMIIALMAF